MNSRHHSTLVVFALALLAPAAAGAQATAAPGGVPEQAASDGRHAFRKVRILYDRNAWRAEARRKAGDRRSLPALAMDLGDEIVRRRLAVPERVPTSQFGRLALRFKGVSPDEYRPKEHTEAVWLTMTLTLTEARKPIAGEILDEVLARIRGLFNERHEGYVTQLREEISATTAQLKADRAELEKAKATEKDLRGQVWRFVDYEETSLQIKEHSRSAAALEIELAGKRARMKAALRQIAEIKDRAAEKAAGDPAKRELAKLVDILEQGVKIQERLVQQGAANVTSLQSARGKLAEAKVRLIERSESIVEMAGGSVLAKLNEELAMLGLDTVELEAKERMTRMMLVQLRQLRDDKLRHEEAKARIIELERAIPDNAGKPDELAQRLREAEPPILTVVAKGPKTQPAGFGTTPKTPKP